MYSLSLNASGKKIVNHESHKLLLRKTIAQILPKVKTFS
jgi:hypothetical protein